MSYFTSLIISFMYKSESQLIKTVYSLLKLYTHHHAEIRHCFGCSRFVSECPIFTSISQNLYTIENIFRVIGVAAAAEENRNLELADSLVIIFQVCDSVQSKFKPFQNFSTLGLTDSSTCKKGKRHQWDSWTIITSSTLSICWLWSFNRLLGLAYFICSDKNEMSTVFVSLLCKWQALNTIRFL